MYTPSARHVLSERALLVSLVRRSSNPAQERFAICLQIRACYGSGRRANAWR